MTDQEAATSLLWSPPPKPIPTSLLWSPGCPAGSTSSASNYGSVPSVNMTPNPVRRFAQIVKLKPEHALKYRQIHAAVWPGVVEQIKDCNIHDYSIFYDPGTGILFASFKYVGSDYAADMAKMRENVIVREWWKMTDSFQESLVPGAISSASGEPSWWKPMEELYYIE